MYCFKPPTFQYFVTKTALDFPSGSVVKKKKKSVCNAVDSGDIGLISYRKIKENTIFFKFSKCCHFLLFLYSKINKFKIEIV